METFIALCCVELYLDFRSVVKDICRIYILLVDVMLLFQRFNTIVSEKKGKANLKGDRLLIVMRRDKSM